MKSSLVVPVLFSILIILILRAILVSTTEGPPYHHSHQIRRRKIVAWLSAIGGSIILLLIYYFNNFFVSAWWFIGFYIPSSVFFARKYGASRGIIYTSNIYLREIKVPAHDVGLFDVCFCIVLGMAYSMSNSLSPLETYSMWISLIAGTAIGVIFYEAKWYKIWLANLRIGNSLDFEHIIKPPKKKKEEIRGKSRYRIQIEWSTFLGLSNWLFLLFIYAGIPILIGYKTNWPFNEYGILLCLLAYITPWILSQIKTSIVKRRAAKSYIQLLAATSKKNIEKVCAVLNKSRQLHWTADDIIDTFFKRSKKAFDNFIDVYNKGLGCRELIRPLWNKGVRIEHSNFGPGKKRREDRIESVMKLINNKSVPVDHRATFLGYLLKLMESKAVSSYFSSFPELLSDVLLMEDLYKIHGMKISSK